MVPWLDSFNAALTFREVIGPYEIEFNHFHPSYDSDIIVGVWRAWPIKEGSTLPLLVCGANAKAYGEYVPGDVWDITPARGAVYTRKEFLTPMGVANAVCYWATGYERIKQLVKTTLQNKGIIV